MLIAELVFADKFLSLLEATVRHNLQTTVETGDYVYDPCSFSIPNHSITSSAYSSLVRGEIYFKVIKSYSLLNCNPKRDSEN